MIISRTPFRVSFFGGGTDYPGWYRNHGGAVLATTIDKYCYITCRYLPPFFEHKYCIMYSKTEFCNTIDEIVHPSVREVLRYLRVSRGVEIHHDGDIPARSGMGSSSAFTVGLLHALHALLGEMRGKKQLADESLYLEQEILKETVGSQDQVLAAYGGFNHISFMQNGDISVRPVTIGSERLKELESHMMLFYTGIIRTASNIADSFVPTIEDKRRQLRFMKDLVDEGLAIVSGGHDIEAFGSLLHEAWDAKRSLSDAVSNPAVDGMYETARAAGAIGGKLIGAGGGGFLLLFAPPERRKKVRAALQSLIHVPFHFESSGSQIIFFDREAEYIEEEEQRGSLPIEAFRELTTDPV